jgi:hypothetical protein
VDYRELNVACIQQIAKHFGIALSNDELDCIQQRMQRHSKEPDRQFAPDSLQKQQVFDSDQQVKIRNRLMPAYEELLSNGILSPKNGSFGLNSNPAIT